MVTNVSIYIVDRPLAGMLSIFNLLQTYEFHFQRCDEINFQTNVNRIQYYEIEYHTVEIKW